MSIDKIIAWVATIGCCVWLISAVSTWGPWVDNLECSAPKIAKKVTL